MDKNFVAKGVATQLYATENAIDAALGEASKLIGVMLEARKELDLSATVGDDSLAKIAAAMAALTAARTATVEAHGALATTAKRLRVRTTAGGSKTDDDVIIPVARLNARAS